MNDKKPNRKNTNDPRYRYLGIDMTDTVSSTDFTGLIPANPDTDEELDAYEEIHDFNNDIPNDDKD